VNKLILTCFVFIGLIQLNLFADDTQPEFSCEEIGSSCDRGMDPCSSNGCFSSCVSTFLFSDWFVEGRVGTFVPLKHHLRKDFGNTWMTYQLQLSRRFWFLEGWVNASWTSKHGHSSGRVNLLPISAGVNYNIISLFGLDLYAGVGASYSWMNLKEKSGSHKDHIHQKKTGFVAKSGLLQLCLPRSFCRLFLHPF
jgi:hypothetical protein